MEHNCTNCFYNFYNQSCETCETCETCECYQDPDDTEGRYNCWCIENGMEPCKHWRADEE